MALEPIVDPAAVFDRAFWTNAANAAVRAECGWHVAPVITETLELDGSGTQNLLLPSGRVVSLISVINDGADVTEKVRTSKRNGYLHLASGWSPLPGSVHVTLDHGYNLQEVPDVAGVIAALIGRASSGAGNVVSQAIAAANVRYGTNSEGAVHSIPLLQTEKDTLAPYKLHWGV